jgi:hypothetical protein
MSSRLRQAGFEMIEVRFTGFFPRALACLRPMERWLGWAPMGAQYYAVAVA